MPAVLVRRLRVVAGGVRCVSEIACVCGQVVAGHLDAVGPEHVFEPLGMDSTGFTPCEAVCRQCVPSTRESHGEGADGFLQGQVHDPLAAMQAGVSGNAGLFSTAADLGRFARMMLSPG